MTFARDMYLLREWVGVCRDLGLWPNVAEFLRLRKSYSEAGRHYHTFEHLYECMIFANSYFRSRVSLPVVKMALFYHDVIYDVRSKTNEEDSARRFEAFFADKSNGKNNSIFLAKVAHLIRITAGHRIDDAHYNEAAPLMIDTDLHILGAETPRYIRYACDIWKEYSSVGRDAYLEGRLKFLDSLDPNNIFYTDTGKSLVRQVEANIALEKRLLGDGVIFA